MLNIRKNDTFAVKLTILAVLTLITSMGKILPPSNSVSKSALSIETVSSKDTSSSHVRLTPQAVNKVHIGSGHDQGSNRRGPNTCQIVKATTLWNTFIQVRHVFQNYQSRCFTSKTQTGSSFIHQGHSPPIS